VNKINNTEQTLESSTHVGSNVGNQATLVNAETAGELIRASSVRPPDLDSGPTGVTRHSISSLQNGAASMTTEHGDIRHPVCVLTGTVPLCWQFTTGCKGGALWCDDVSNKGNTGWHAVELVRKR